MRKSVTSIPASPARTCIQRIIHGRVFPTDGSARASAPANIALVKYWGKRDAALNLPVTSSLSISLADLGSTVEIAVLTPATEDVIWLNGTRLPPKSPFATRLSAYLDLFRPDHCFRFIVKTHNTIPTAAGFASSASGFASVVRALDTLFNWRLSAKNLSILARIGSGSASRSLQSGFVEWRAGVQRDGTDSYATRLAAEWPEFRVGALVLSTKEKPIGSRAAMQNSVATSPAYAIWPARVKHDLATVKRAIRTKDFALLGETAEANAIAMHTLMLTSTPPLFYALPETIAIWHAIWDARKKGLPLWFTMDAGPNVKLLFERQHTARIRRLFPTVEIISPFTT